MSIERARGGLTAGSGIKMSDVRQQCGRAWGPGGGRRGRQGARGGGRGEGAPRY